MPTRPRWMAAVLALAALCGAGAPVRAGDGRVEEKVAKIKAAYLLNFIKFAQWPDSAFENDRSPIVVGVLGPDPFGDVLDATMHQKRIGDRPIRVQRIDAPRRSDYANGDSFDSAWEQAMQRVHRCHLLYISAGGNSTLCRRLHERLDAAAVLTVGDGPPCAEHGAMLALGRDANRIIFYANLHAIETSGVRISSKLLRLARVIDAR